jgi:hypothetical protein
MSQNLQTQVRKVPLIISVLVVLIIVLLLSLTLLRFSGVLGTYPSPDPNGVTNGSMINPDGLASGCSTDPNGGSCQPHANGLLAAGSGMDGNGHS